jgi:hypothetical protein
VITDAGRNPRVEAVQAGAYSISPDEPEADGTLQWDSATLVVVEVAGGGETGLGYTYTDACTVSLIAGRLAEVVTQHHALDPQAAWQWHAACGAE